MKIIYTKCGVNNYMNEDHRSYSGSSSVGGYDGSSSSSNTSGRNNKSSGGTRVLKVHNYQLRIFFLRT